MFQLLTAHGFFNLARAFIGAVLFVYLLDNQIALETILWAKSAQLFVSVLANYHAGKLADRFGKKTAVILSCVCSLIYFALMLEPTPAKVMLGEMFNGLCIAFYMGAYESWAFEFKNEKENSFSLISRSAEIFFLSSIFATIIGALYFAQALYFSLIFMLLAIVAYAITPQKSRRTLSSSSHFWADVKTFVTQADRSLWFYLLFAGAMQIIYHFWAVFFSRNLAVENEQLGYVLALMFAVQWLFSRLARHFRFNQNTYAKPLVLLAVLGFSLLTVFGYWAALPFYVIALGFLLFVGSCGLSANLFFAQSCQRFAEQSNESSMISLIDALARVIGAAVFAMFSAISVEAVPYVWLVFSGLVAGYLLLSRR